MVKNTQGGSSHKKFGRKFATSGRSNKLRVSEDEGEVYAIVTKMLGNNMFHCCCIDEKVRLGHIRGKFTGRGKRDNMVQGGKWVLIGIREWDAPSEKSTMTKALTKIQHCDLLEVYSDTDRQHLKDSVSEDWSILDKHDVYKDDSKTELETKGGFVFGTDADFEREKLIAEMKSVTAEKISLKISETDEVEEEINIDDI